MDLSNHRLIDSHHRLCSLKNEKWPAHQSYVLTKSNNLSVKKWLSFKYTERNLYSTLPMCGFSSRVHFAGVEGPYFRQILRCSKLEKYYHGYYMTLVHSNSTVLDFLSENHQIPCYLNKHIKYNIVLTFSKMGF